MTSPGAPTALVSWAHQNTSWDREQTRHWEDTVRRFAELLVESRVDVELDLWNLHDSTIDWTRFGPTKVRECSFVIIAVSTAWRQRWEGRNAPTEGAGAVAEADELKGLFANSQDEFQRKTLIAVLPGASAADVPPGLSRVNRFHIDELTSDGIKELLHTLYVRPRYLKPQLGPMPDLPPAPPVSGTSPVPPDLTTPAGTNNHPDAVSGTGIGVQNAVHVSGTGNVVTVGDHHTSNTYISEGPKSLYERVTRETYLDRMRAATKARLKSRRFGAGLNADQVARSLTHPVRVPHALRDMSPGELRVLVGSLGTGKSDIAETWLDECTARAHNDPNAPVPVWVSAADLDSPLGHRIVDEIGIETLTETGAAVVVDGLDEHPEQAAAVLRQASDFVAKWPKSRAVLTSRDMEKVNEQLVVETPLLSNLQAHRLVRLVAGRRIGDLGPHLEVAITRPFFALLVARYADAVEGATGIPELIDRVVDDTVTAEGYDLYSGLRQLAVETIRRGKPVDPARFTSADIAAQIRKSSLITASGRNNCTFSLAIFEQWFAAKAVLEREVQIDQLLTTLQSFDRWKYVFAMVLAAGEPTRVDPVMAALARWNPGAATWVIRETRTGGLSRSTPDVGPDDWEEVGDRIRIATAAWLDGLGPLADAFHLYTHTGTRDFDAVTVAIDISPLRLRVSWLLSGEDADRPLPPVISADEIPDNRTMIQRGHAIPTGPNWVWETTRDHLAKDVKKRFVSLAVPIAQQHPGIVRDEMPPQLRRRYEVAQRLRELGSGVNQDQAAGSSHLAAIRSLFADDSSDLHEPRLQYPQPDMTSASLSVGGLFHPETMLERCRQVFSAALTCYRELCETVVPAFGDTLAHRGMMPVELYGTVTYDPHSERSSFDFPGPLEPGVTWVLKPIGTPLVNGRRDGNSTVSLTLNDETRAAEIRDDRDNLYKAFRSYVESYPAYEPFAGSFTSHSGRYRVLEDRPATRIALSWLWEDLKELGWTEGAFPHSL